MARGGKRRTCVEERGVWGRVMVALSKQCSFSKWPTRGHILLDDIEEGGVTSEMYDGRWVPKSREGDGLYVLAGEGHEAVACHGWRGEVGSFLIIETRRDSGERRGHGVHHHHLNHC